MTDYTADPSNLQAVLNTATNNDTVNLVSGNYTAEYTVAGRGISAAQPLTIRSIVKHGARFTGNNARLRAQSWVSLGRDGGNRYSSINNGQPYIVFDGLLFQDLRFRTTEAVIWGSQMPRESMCVSGFWTLRNCKFERYGMGLQVSGNNILIEDCEWYDGEGRRVHWLIGTGCNDLTIRRCTIHRVNMEQVGNINVAWSGVHKLLFNERAIIEDCDIRFTRGPMVWFDFDNFDCIVRNNYFSNWRRPWDATWNGVAFWWEANGRASVQGGREGNLLLEGNTFDTSFAGESPAVDILESVGGTVQGNTFINCQTYEIGMRNFAASDGRPFCRNWDFVNNSFQGGHSNQGYIQNRDNFTSSIYNPANCVSQAGILFDKNEFVGKTQRVIWRGISYTPLATIQSNFTSWEANTYDWSAGAGTFNESVTFAATAGMTAAGEGGVENPGTFFDSLADDASATSAAIDSGTPAALAMELELTIVGASASNTALVDIYLKRSQDGSDFDDDLNDQWIASVQMNGTTPAKSVVFVDHLPPSFKLRAHNQSGDALASSGSGFEWKAVDYAG